MAASLHARLNRGRRFDAVFPKVCSLTEGGCVNRLKLVLSAFVIACIAGVASAQEAPAKAYDGPAKAQPMKAVQAPTTYGAGSSFYRMGGAEFTPLDIPGVDDYSDTYYTVSGATFRRHATIADAYFIGTPHLPSGAKVLTVNVHDCVNTAGTVYGDVSACNNYGNFCTVLAPIVTTAGCGYDVVDVSAAGYVVDNSPAGNLLVIRIATANTDGSDSFAGVTIEYQLQVSPAPLVATFPDVPTSDFGFQFVEALVASGITGGCGSGLYCPDSPVTRRQMAIFIAKALGLHFQ